MGKYLVIIIWFTLFMYFFNMVMPKNGWYLVISLPLLLFTSFSILKFFEKREAAKEP